MTEVQTIIQKAKSDMQFANLILKDPKKALATYKLTSVEIKEVVDTVKTFEIRGIWPVD